MEIKEFKKYCIQKQKKLESELASVRDSLNLLPDPDNIKLPEGEDLLQLERKYRATNRLSLRQRFLGISTPDLQQFLRKDKERNLQKKSKQLSRQISELRAITDAEDNIISTIPSNNSYIIITLLDYCLEKEFTTSKALDYLLELFKCSTTEEKVTISLYERDVLSHFQPNGHIEHDRVNGALFVIDKLFAQIIPENHSKYRELISALKQEITERDSLVLANRPAKKELLTQKDAIAKLQEYIEKDNVVAVTNNIEYFAKLLKTAQIPDSESQKYILQMQTLIAKERRERDIKIVEQELTPEELKTLLSAQKLALSISQEQSDILIRLTKDIISLCRYLNMGIPPEERTYTLEMLGTKTHLLTEATKMIKKPVAEQSSYRYIIGDDGIPTIIRNIETIDPLYYPNLYNKLVTIPAEEQIAPTFTQAGIDFYIEQSQEVSIVYTIVNGKRVLIYATVQKDVDKICENIPSSTIEAIKKMQENPEENYELEQNYENLLIKLLDLYDGIQNKTLKK